MVDFKSGGHFVNGDILNAEELNTMLDGIYEDQLIVLNAPSYSIYDQIDVTSYNGASLYDIAYINNNGKIGFKKKTDISNSELARRIGMVAWVDAAATSGTQLCDRNMIIIGGRDATCPPSEALLHHPTTFSATLETAVGTYDQSLQPSTTSPKYTIKASTSPSPSGNFGNTPTDKIGRIMMQKGGFEAQAYCNRFNPHPSMLNTRSWWVLPSIEDFNHISQATLLDSKLAEIGDCPLRCNILPHFTCNEYDADRVWLYAPGTADGYNVVEKNTIGAQVIATRAILSIVKQTAN